MIQFERGDALGLVATTTNAGPRHLGRYELLATLATGGMGEVYLACTRGVGGFERLVVVKCALPAIGQGEQMLLAEARIAANLQHTNIVQVYDVGIEQGRVFLAMEYLHGQDLRAVIARSWGTHRPLGLDPTLAITLSICAGLQYAHDKRNSDGSPLELVHRDVSPSNVIVTYDGSVKLIDFGIAKATSLPSETQLGTVKGKPGHMSPEQCLSEPLDRRSDVFCVGIILYELTTGRRACRGDSEFAITKAIVELDPVWPSELDRGYPAELEAIVKRALAKDRRDRYPTTVALHNELAAFASRQRLDMSQFALQRAMASLFEAELQAWQAAQAEEDAIVEFVVQQTGSVSLPTPISPPTVDTAETRPRGPTTIGAATVPDRSTPVPTPPARKHARVAIAGGVMIALVAGGIAWRYASRTDEPVQLAAPTSTEPAPVVAPPPPAPVEPPAIVTATAPSIDAGVPTASPSRRPTHHVDHRVGPTPTPLPPEPTRAAPKRPDPDEIIR